MVFRLLKTTTRVAVFSGTSTENVSPLLVLEASGHVPYVEQPDALFGAIEQYLAETTLNGGTQDAQPGRKR